MGSYPGRYQEEEKNLIIVCILMAPFLQKPQLSAYLYFKLFKLGIVINCD